MQQKSTGLPEDVSSGKLGASSAPHIQRSFRITYDSQANGLGLGRAAQVW